MARKRAVDSTIASNRAALHNYFILERVEAGLELRGTEIKSLREGGANLREGYVRFGGGEAFLVNVHISPYERGYSSNQEVKRERKLLLHKSEIIRLGITIKQKGLTLVPLRLYWKGNRGTTNGRPLLPGMLGARWTERGGFASSQARFHSGGRGRRRRPRTRPW